MKKIIYTLALTTLIWSCGGGGDTPPSPVNHAPTTPILGNPVNNLFCLDNALDFDWSASTDSDPGDVITYHIEVAKNNQFSPIYQNLSATSISISTTLEQDVAYYWRVKATDGEDSSSYSSIHKFYTYGVGVTNQLPFMPELITPGLNSTVTTGATATLQWTADDVNTTDILTFDVYFGTDLVPVSIASADQLTTSYVTPTLIASTPYYWKVVVKDGEGGQTIGQTWSFTTD